MSPKGDLLMILDTESWMNIRRFRALHAGGARFAEIGRESGCDWRTVRQYLAEDAASVPPTGPPRAGTQPLLITPFVAVVEAWLRADLTIKGTVVHERLVAEYGFTGHYQRVKMFLAEARPRIATELADRDENPLSGLHRRFEVVPGAQAQVDWGDEGDLLAHVGIPTVYSFHMVLSHSRDPFCCFTTRMDLATFWDCHRRAFAHFGGVPGAIVYDRTKTVIRRHVAPGIAVPLHPEAAAFADHYGFTIDVLAAYQPTGSPGSQSGPDRRLRPQPQSRDQPSESSSQEPPLLMPSIHFSGITVSHRSLLASLGQSLCITTSAPSAAAVDQIPDVDARRWPKARRCRASVAVPATRRVAENEPGRRPGSRCGDSAPWRVST